MLSAQQIVADGNSAAQVIEEKCGSSSIARNKKPPFEYWVVDLAVKVALPESVGPLSLARNTQPTHGMRLNHQVEQWQPS